VSKALSSTKATVSSRCESFKGLISRWTPASERWYVNTEDCNESGRVYLELADATPTEATRGMALLTKLVA
jgi:hypothetical protein